MHGSASVVTATHTRQAHKLRLSDYHSSEDWLLMARGGLSTCIRIQHGNDIKRLSGELHETRAGLNMHEGVSRRKWKQVHSVHTHTGLLNR